MFDDLRDLYQEVILDHGKNPRNLRQPADANRLAHGDNPLCGDKIVVYLKVDDDRTIRDVAFDGRGCAISMASASMMTEILKGKTVDDATRLFDSFHKMCTEEAFEPDAGADPDDLDRLSVLAGVREFPIRVKCATLAWHTMQAAIEDSRETVSTE